MVEKAHIISRLQHLFNKREETCLVVLFGSHSLGTANENSDVDVAIYNNAKLQADQKIKLTRELEQEFGSSVDMVDLSTVNSFFLSQILTKGEVVVNKAPDVLEQLIKRIVYYNADFMPMYRKALKQSAQRFVDGC